MLAVCAALALFLTMPMVTGQIQDDQQDPLQDDQDDPLDDNQQQQGADDEASVTLEDQQVDANTVEIQEVTLPEGGFVVLWEADDAQAGASPSPGTSPTDGASPTPDDQATPTPSPDDQATPTSSPDDQEGQFQTNQFGDDQATPTPTPDESPGTTETPGQTPDGLQGENQSQALGQSDYLEPGSHTNVTVTLNESFQGDVEVTATLYRDTTGTQTFDEEQDQPYEVDGETVEATATLTFQEDVGEQPRESPRSPVTSPTPEDDDPEATPAPGLIVVVALAALALLVGRRR